MASSDIEKEMLNVLDDNEIDIDKIAFVSHNFLLMTSMKNAHEIIQTKKKQMVKFLIKKKK